MEIKKVAESVYAVRLFVDEEIISCLTQCAKEYKFFSASLQGIGAVKDIEIGFYELPQKKFEKKFLKEDHELLSALGNITWFENQPIIHIHVTLGGADYKVIGGHLFSAKIAVAGEFFLTAYPTKVLRTPNPNIGLNLWNLKQCG